MKKQISAFLSFLITAGTLSMMPVSAAGALLCSDFENGLGGWTARGNASVAQTRETAASGTGSAAVTDRSDSWCGIAYALDTSVFLPGTAYSFRASVMQKTTPMAVHFKMALQYSTGSGYGSEIYDSIAEEDAASGMWSVLSNASYTIPANAQNPVLYIETTDSVTDFFADEIYIAAAGTASPDYPIGDVDRSGTVTAHDAEILRDYLLAKTADGVFFDTADLDRSGSLDAADLTALKRLLLTQTAATTVSATDPLPTETTVTTAAAGTHADPSEYMEGVRSQMAIMQSDVPAEVQRGDTGTTTHITYYSKKAQREKGANVWLPAGYSADRTYPVLYMNHGIMGNENNMLSGFAIREMASQLIASGEAVPFIIVFPQMYTDPNADSPVGFNMNTMDHYDDFLYDLTESLMPYISAHYSVKTGRENTAVAGFSMGGRESLYIGISRPDLFGYIAASSPAPGIVPASDNFMQHDGSFIAGSSTRMTNADFRISQDQMPYLLMIAGGTNDTVVGTFPRQYHELFAQNGTDHIWAEVPGGSHDGSVGIALFYNFFRAVFKA